MTWSNTMADMWRVISDKGLAGLMALGIQSELNHLVAHPKDTETFYAAAERGVTIMTKTQRTKSSTGFNIPLVRSLFVSPYSDWIFAGTPGGLYISQDGAQSWRDGQLWLQFEKNTRRELGGAAFIDAYWRARYYGFIDEATAQQAIHAPSP